jgi:hypothetical protein
MNIGKSDSGNIHFGFSSLLVDGKLFSLHPGALTPFSEAGEDHLINSLLAVINGKRSGRHLHLLKIAAHKHPFLISLHD